MSGVRGIPGVDFTVEDVRGEFPESVEIQPLEAPPDAEIRVPGSKSVTNRALLVAALADGASSLHNPLFSDDSYWLMQALAKLGFEVHADEAEAKVEIEGLRGIIPLAEVEIFVGNAGTVARFLPPFLALGRGPYRVDGSPRMRERPVADLVEAMRRLGAAVRYGEGEGRFPMVVRGGGIRGGEARVRGGQSSQFLSGLLMSAPYADEPVELEVEGELVSRPYVGITTGVMREFGVKAEEDSDGTFRVSPSHYEAREYTVEPDASGASYFVAAAAVSGGRVRVVGLGSGSSQGDARFAEVLEEMGCEAEYGEDHIEVRGPERLRGVDVDMNDISDTMMTLAAIAPFADGPTRITGVGHTRHQETDRISAVARELERLGVGVKEGPDGIEITPGQVRPATVRTYDDHRMAMAFALVGLMVPGVRIDNPACVTKTLPRYFDLLESLR